MTDNILTDRYTKEYKYNQTNIYLFFFSYILYIVSQFISIVNVPNFIPGSLKYLIVGILGFIVLRNKYNSRNVLLNILYGGIILASSIASNQNTNLILLFLFIFCSAFVKFKNIVKIQFWIMSFLMMFVQVGYMVGYIPEINYTTYYRGENTRLSMGYIYTSFFSNLLMHLTIMYIYLKRKINIIEVVIILVINQYIYNNTFTQSAYYLTILAIVGAYIYMKFDLGDKISKGLKITVFNIVYLFFVIFPWYTSYIYNPNIEWMYNLNSMLTGRVKLGNEGLEKYGVTLFGSDVEWIVLEKAVLLKEYFFVDSSSLSTLINYGLIFSIFIAVTFYLMTKRMIIKNNNKGFIIVVIVLLLHSTFDPQFLSLLYNPFLLLIGLAINPRGKE